ncbi:MAG TPA: nucleotidyl transferase AbiEii/AbiGii toxin family protein [Thermoanaerobaculia bacterium]|nr:nucleotidyl transferase AbiEii/AbiGii toxin family protein [Thermoanaerobaculia bacterium]
MDYELVKQVLHGFEREGVEYVIIGAVALNFHGLARFTEDLDVFIAPERENVERLKRALRSVFDDPEIDRITAEDLMGDYPAVQYVPPEGTFHIDVLTRLGTAFTYEDLESERIPFEELMITVASPRTLVRMKESTGRLKDRADAELLRKRFSLREE